MTTDTGFTCPKCRYRFPTQELVFTHLKNEHVDGTQSETARYEPDHMY
jgi:hypothetical protein